MYITGTDTSTRSLDHSSRRTRSGYIVHRNGNIKRFILLKNYLGARSKKWMRDFIDHGYSSFDESNHDERFGMAVVDEKDGTQFIENLVKNGA